MPATGTSSSCGRCCSSRSSVFSRSRPRMRRWRRSLPAALLFRSPRLRLRRENSWSAPLVLVLLVGQCGEDVVQLGDPVRTHADGRRGHASGRARRGGDGASAARSHRPHPGDGARGIPAWRPDPARRAGWRRIRRRTDAHGRRATRTAFGLLRRLRGGGGGGRRDARGAAARLGRGGLGRWGLLGRAAYGEAQYSSARGPLHLPGPLPRYARPAGWRAIPAYASSDVPRRPICLASSLSSGSFISSRFWLLATVGTFPWP